MVVHLERIPKESRRNGRGMRRIWLIDVQRCQFVFICLLQEFGKNCWECVVFHVFDYWFIARNVCSIDIPLGLDLYAEDPSENPAGFNSFHFHMSIILNYYQYLCLFWWEFLWFLLILFIKFGKFLNLLNIIIEIIILNQYLCLFWGQFLWFLLFFFEFFEFFKEEVNNLICLLDYSILLQWFGPNRWISVQIFAEW